MAEIDIINLENKKVGKLELNDSVFNCEVKSHLLHSVVRAQLMNKRGGDACTKGRSQVRGGGAKPWRQKGTGRARAGTSSSPIWVGGGVAFGPTTRKYNISLNKKAKKLALRSALSAKFRNNDILVVDNYELSDHKTKGFIKTIETLGAQKPLIVSSGSNSNLDLSSRNVRDVKVLRSEGLNVYDILNHGTLILTRESVGKVEEVLVNE